MGRGRRRDPTKAPSATSSHLRSPRSPPPPTLPRARGPPRSYPTSGRRANFIPWTAATTSPGTWTLVPNCIHTKASRTRSTTYKTTTRPTPEVSSLAPAGRVRAHGAVRPACTWPSGYFTIAGEGRSERGGAALRHSPPTPSLLSFLRARTLADTHLHAHIHSHARSRHGKCGEQGACTGTCTCSHTDRDATTIDW